MKIEKERLVDQDVSPTFIGILEGKSYSIDVSSVQQGLIKVYHFVGTETLSEDSNKN